MGEVGLRSAVAILIVGTGVGLAVGSANADTAETAAPVAPVELEAPDGADSGVRDAMPAAQRAERLRERLERRELRRQQLEKRLAHAREVLFDGIELSPEQSRAVDAIIEGELKVGRRSGELQAELQTARQQGDQERVRASRRESRAVRGQRKGPNESMEEMRALLSEEQRPTFDMNRALLAAEGKKPQERRRRTRPRVDAAAEGADAAVEAEGADAAVEAEGADAEVEAEGADAEVEAEGADAEVEAEGADAAVKAE